MKQESTSPDEQQAHMKSLIRKTFDAVANDYGLGACRFFHDSARAMVELMPLRGNEQVLDVACGTGATAIPLARRLSTGQVTAVDMSAGMLARLQARAKDAALDNVQTFEHDMTALPFADGQFDHATCAFGLFFVEDMNGLLRHIADKCRPGGSVLVSGFTGDSFLPYADMTMTMLREFGLELPAQPMGWKRMAEPEQLHALFNSAGLGEVDIVRQSLGYHIEPQEWWDVVWNAGFRGLVAQLGERVDEFKQQLLAQVAQLADARGLWLEVDVNFTRGVRP